MLARIPDIAITALRAHVERFLDVHGAALGQPLSETEVDSLNLAEMLVAALQYVREEHPWIGLKGVVLEPPERDPWEVALAAAKALPDDDLPLTMDTCIEALRSAKDFKIVREPCGHRTAAPRAYVYHLYGIPDALGDIDLTSRLYGIVAETDWLNSATRRNQAFDAALPPNHELHSFVELDSATACTLASFIMAGRGYTRHHKSYLEAAAAFVEIFGKQTRVFALEDPDSEALENPFDHAPDWSQYDEKGYGAWGQTLVVVATDGLRVAYVDAYWDITCET